MQTNLDALLTALYVIADDFLPKRCGPGRPPQISDAEIITLAVAQMLLDCPNDRRFLNIANYRLRHLFAYLPRQSGYNKRVRALTGEIVEFINHLFKISPAFCDSIRLLDSTPIPCGASRQTVKRSELAGYAGYGYCAAHSRWFWGFRLYLLCSRDGMPVAFELAPANAAEREVAKQMLETIEVNGHTIVADKGFDGQELEDTFVDAGALLVTPDRKNAKRRYGSLGGIRQWVESVFWTCKGQLSLERHGGRTLSGVCARVCIRLLALAGCIWHNQLIGKPGRHLAQYGY